MEVSKIGEIVDGVRKIKVSTYLSESLEQDETVKHQRQEIKQKSIELLELIANYNDTYKNTAKKLVDGVEKQELMMCMIVSMNQRNTIA